MDKYVGGDRLHLYLLSASLSNAPVASWENHRVICNNKQSSMSQILSLERSTGLLFSPLSLIFFFLPSKIFFYATAFTVFIGLSAQILKHACSYITSSRWLDNLHQFKLATKGPHHPQSHYWLSLQESSGCFQRVWEPCALCKEREIRETR